VDASGDAGEARLDGMTAAISSAMTDEPPVAEPTPLPQAHRGRGPLDVIMGVVFVVIGVLLLTAPSAPGRTNVLALVGAVNVVVGLVKFVRGLRSTEI